MDDGKEGVMTYDIRHILVPVDLSDSGGAAVRYAELFSRRLVAPITLMYADQLLYPLELTPAAAAVASTPEHQERLRREVAAYGTGLLGERPFDVQVKFGPPASMILRTAEEIGARLIVMGSHGHNRWQRMLIGSVAHDVLDRSDCPVLLVRSGDVAPAVTRILCPVNFTEAARESLRFAARIADLFGADLIVVHVIEPGAAPMNELQVRSWIEPEMRESAKFFELIRHGGAAERVLACAEDLGADLLIVGAQHKIFRDETVIGTTTERLIQFATCPVLTFPRAAKRKHVEEHEEELVLVG
jgi:nucleotide-binding universal stress UspA family protein